MGWSEPHGRVSRAFNEWALIDRDQRAFLRFGLRIARDAYDRLWEEAAHEPGDPEGPELVDVFDDRIEGLWPHDYEWMYLSAIFRDAVTNFEVYLDKASEEILRHHGVAFSRPPRWHDLTAFFEMLNVTIASEAVRQVRDLRHFLTHQRGELRTEAQRKKFAAQSESPISPVVVELSDDAVVKAMGELGEAVRTIDPAVWEHTFGGKRLADLAAIVDPTQG